MGVKKLWDILEPCKVQLPLLHLQNKRLCVDLSYWVTQLHQVHKGSIREKPHLRGLFHRIRALLALNCSLVFVADGDIPAIKVAAYRRRVASTHREPLGPRQEVAGPMKRNKGSEFSLMIQEAIKLGEAFGIPCLTSLEEAEAQCAILDSGGICDGCFTADSDALLFGARTVYKEISLGSSGDGYVIAYSSVTIQKELGLGRNSLIALAVLLGGDYCSGVYGVGTDKAFQVVKEVGDDEILDQLTKDGLSVFMRHLKPQNKTKNRKNCGININKENNYGMPPNSISDNLALHVVDAYLKPNCHSQGSVPLQRISVNGPVNLHELQKICMEAFGWLTEKTDEYVLPKIAERDVRCLAYAAAPMASTPCQYKISEITKVRVQHGVDCFEVTWVGKPYLKDSILPADIVKRAYPEKVEEFFYKRAMTKKTQKIETRSRGRKADNQRSKPGKGLPSDIEKELRAEFDKFHLQPDLDSHISTEHLRIKDTDKRCNRDIYQKIVTSRGEGFLETDVSFPKSIEYRTGTVEQVDHTIGMFFPSGCKADHTSTVVTTNWPEHEFIQGNFKDQNLERVEVSTTRSVAAERDWMNEICCNSPEQLPKESTLETTSCFAGRSSTCFLSDMTEVVDLTTPSPPHTCVNEYKKSPIKNSAVLCLEGDSGQETESMIRQLSTAFISPMALPREPIDADMDHQRRAQELRAFLAIIKSDLNNLQGRCERL